MNLPLCPQKSFIYLFYKNTCCAFCLASWFLASYCNFSCMWSHWVLQVNILAVRCYVDQVWTFIPLFSFVWSQFLISAEWFCFLFQVAVTFIRVLHMVYHSYAYLDPRFIDKLGNVWYYLINLSGKISAVILCRLVCTLTFSYSFVGVSCSFIFGGIVDFYHVLWCSFPIISHYFLSKLL